MRVHELAKEMDKTNKEVLDVLKEKNIEVKSHMSSLSNEEIDVVKKSFAENTEKEEPKKKHIVQVFRPQNSKNAGKMGGNRGGKNSGNRDGKSGGNREGRQNQSGKSSFNKEKADRNERPVQDNNQVRKNANNAAAP